jgi:O-acetylhomoserine/O-acetylserine sulfhydrylase-like pyridoxal-dependent enzyme
MAAVHSATKWIGGHGTTMAGVIVDAGMSQNTSNVIFAPHMCQANSIGLVLADSLRSRSLPTVIMA